MPLDAVEIENLLNSDESDLYSELGAQLASGKLGARPRSREEHIMHARRWLDNRRLHICQLLAGSAELRSFLNAPHTFGRVELFTCIVDVLGTIAGGPAVATASAVIIKRGIPWLCPELGCANGS